MAPPSPAPFARTMKVLVMQQKRVGDVLASSLLCENLRRHIPQVEIHFLAHRQATAVLQGNPHIDHVHACAARSPLSRQWRLAAELRRQRYDVVIDVYAKTESLLLVAGCRARRSIGYRKWYTRLVYTDPVQRVAQPAHGLPLAIEHRLQLLEPLLGSLPIGQLATRPRLYIDARERDDARAFLAGHGITTDRPLLMIGALGSEPAKSYPLPAMARLLDRIAGRCDAQLLFNCLPEQRAEVESLYRLCAAPTRAHIVMQALPQGLRQFIAVLGECRALIGNEGGAVNMARALDVPTFSIFSPWIPKQHWGFDHEPQHPAVHLEDFAPGSFEGRSTADLRQHVDALYAQFRPEWIEPALDRFLATLCEPTSA